MYYHFTSRKQFSKNHGHLCKSTKKNTPVGQRNFGAMWWEGQKNQECHSRTPQLSTCVQPLPPIPGPRSREGQEQIPIQDRRGKSYWVSHARNLLISQSLHCSHPVSEQNVLCPIPNHHQVTERSREPLYHAQPNEPDQRYWNMKEKKRPCNYCSCLSL